MCLYMTQCKLKINRNTALERNHMGDPGKEIHNVTVNTRAKSHSCIYTCTGICYKSIKVKFKSKFCNLVYFSVCLVTSKLYNNFIIRVNWDKGSWEWTKIEKLQPEFNFDKIDLQNNCSFVGKRSFIALPDDLPLIKMLSLWNSWASN